MKFSADKTRRLAAVSVAAAALLGASGCSAVNYQATTQQYSASDGTRAEIENVQFRHMAFITDEAGNPARAMGSIINSGTEDVEVELDVDGESFAATLPAGEKVSLELDEELVVESFQGDPGDMHEITVAVDGETKQVLASVFDGVLPEYRHLLPDGYDESMTEHLVHGPDTWGSGAAHHDPDDAGH
ncbi:hypothetical protein [Nesterenkonia sandarakina]|uniref:Copper(I)-binding protein n=1 Tax=Nesterenkonia sandarakina TaxID=272918 RepID=A0A2T0YGA0_9MICC|nr:hypothetical protein [Nesterenkonia sandarakina]PRZ14008.1 hypothetical protein BCL67_11310 [Nesterenkonia sandarakina]